MSSPCSFLHLTTGFFAVPPLTSPIKGSPCPSPSRCQFYAPLLSPSYVLVLQSSVALPLLFGKGEPSVPSYFVLLISVGRWITL